METIYLGAEETFSISFNADLIVSSVEFTITHEDETVLVDTVLGNENKYEENNQQIYYYNYTTEQVGTIEIKFVVTFDDGTTEEQLDSYYVRKPPVEPTWVPSYPPNIYVDTEPWAISNQQEWVREALLTFGERVILRLRWRWEHEDAGLVQRCTESHQNEKIADVYKQAGSSRCPVCYGVGFVDSEGYGGFRPEIFYMHANIDYSIDERNREESGGIVEHSPSAQFIWTPKLTSGDLLIRAKWDGDQPVELLDRYLLRDVEESEIRAGPKERLDPLVVGQNTTINRLFSDHMLYQVPVG